MHVNQIIKNTPEGNGAEHSRPENSKGHPDKTRCRPDRDCENRACSPFCDKYGEWCLEHNEQPT